MRPLFSVHRSPAVQFLTAELSAAKVTEMLMQKKGVILNQLLKKIQREMLTLHIQTD